MLRWKKRGKPGPIRNWSNAGGDLTGLPARAPKWISGKAPYLLFVCVHPSHLAGKTHTAPGNT